MNGPARLILSSAVVWLFAGNTAFLQVNMQPTPAPTITAERESWYLSGEPITFEGSIYYPAGAQIHFIANEMVRSGIYRGIPIYTRTTIEPYSLIFVPLSGGLMQPYERPRVGEIAGTAGSTTPAFAAATAGTSAIGVTPTVPQAPAPPTQIPGAEQNPGTVGTSGTTIAAPAQPAPAGRVVYMPRPAPLKSAERPRGWNGAYVEFRANRWFSSGPPVPFDSTRFTRIGEYRGFPVYALRGNSAAIYIPTTRDDPSLLAPFARRKR